MKSLATLRALLVKEIILQRRNSFVPRMLVMMPIMVMLVFPLVMTMDVKNVGVVYVDNDCSDLSRRMAADMGASEYMDIVASKFTYAEALNVLEKGDADVIVTIPYGFSKSLGRGEMKKISIDANGVNATKGMLGGRYAAESLMQTISEWNIARGLSAPARDAVFYMYNPTLDYRNYMIPALMVMLILMICGFLPLLGILEEKEQGTIEAMNVTPVGRLVFVLSKLIPYWIIGIVIILIGMLIGRLAYGVSPEGNIGTILLATVLFSLVMSGIGVTIANCSSTVMQGVFVMFGVMIIFNLMGGLFTPISSMPEWAQIITWGVPPRYFIDIMRGVYLKGNSIADLQQPFICLAGIALLLCLVATLTYSKRK